MISSITIDATHFSSTQTTGVENYVSSLLPRLSKLLHEKGVAVSWIGHGDRPSTVPGFVTWVSSPHTSFWSQRGLLNELRLLKPDLFFSPSGLVPLFYRGKTAVTIHDMSAYVAPDSYSVAQKFRLQLLLKQVANRASCIMTPSNYTATLVSKLWNIDSSKITAAHLGVPIPANGTRSISSLERCVSPILFVGRIELKKNLLPLIEGFSKMTDSTQSLILAGKNGLGAELIKDYIAQLPISVQSRIHLTGYITDLQKNWLMDRAICMVVPCKVEGFGIPVLEAFEAKKPLVCAKSGSLPEVADAACLYVSGDSSSEWAQVLERLLSNNELQRALVSKGVERLRHFNWNQTAEKTAQAFLAL